MKRFLDFAHVDDYVERVEVHNALQQTLAQLLSEGKKASLVYDVIQAYSLNDVVTLRE